MKARIFISYCHDDLNPADPRLEVLINALESNTDYPLEIIFDRHDSRAKVGANLDDFINLITTVDAAIVILTSKYKAKVENRDHSVVYKEFSRIQDRINSSETTGTYEKSFIFFPVIFSGNFENSCPFQWKKFVNYNLNWLDVIPESNPAKLRKGTKPQLDDLVKDIASRVNAIAAIREQDFLELTKERYQEFLFADRKSKWNRKETKRYFETAFVKTRAFLYARDRKTAILVGRKGAGKSSIVHVLPQTINPAPLAVVAIEFDHLPFQFCYEILTSKPAIESDISNAYSEIFIYQMLWDGFFYLSACWAMRHNIDSIHNNSIKTLLNSIIDSRDLEGTSQAEQNIIVTRVLFVHCFEQLMQFIDNTIDSKSNGFAKTMSYLIPTRFREKLFAPIEWEQISRFVSRATNRDGRILITLDGFDAQSGYFARTPERAQFQRDLLLSLLQVVLDKGPLGIQDNMYRHTSFCLAIPYDHFIIIRNLDRDRYRYRADLSPLTWTGIELSSLVRKRLALLRHAPDAKGQPLHERLEQVMANNYREIPDSITIRLGSATVDLPLFLYVLRHSFWRPRDILWYYSAILVAVSRFNNARVNVSEGVIKQVIASTTRKILDDEFFGEFESSFNNLRKIIDSLREAKQVLGWLELKLAFEAVRFETSLPKGITADLEWKIETLFELGFLGIMLSSTEAKYYSVYKHAFVFNTNADFLLTIGRERYENYKFIIHPIFREYLHLKTDENPEIVLAMSWDDLYMNDTFGALT